MPSIHSDHQPGGLELRNISQELRNVSPELRNVSLELRNVSSELRNVSFSPIVHTAAGAWREGVVCVCTWTPLYMYGASMYSVVCITGRGCGTASVCSVLTSLSGATPAPAEQPL